MSEAIGDEGKARLQRGLTLDGFHQGTCFCVDGAESLSVVDGKIVAGVRNDGGVDRDTDAIETCDIGGSGDAKGFGDRGRDPHRLRGRDEALDAIDLIHSHQEAQGVAPVLYWRHCNSN